MANRMLPNRSFSRGLRQVVETDITGLITIINHISAAIYARVEEVSLEEHRRVFDVGYFDLLQVAPSNVGLIVGQPGDPRTFGATLKLTL